MKPSRWPILAYHSVADNPGGRWSSLSVPLKRFERQMRYLARHGYRTVPLSRFARLIRSGRPPARTLAITFDDGFLDNWVFVYPILRRYGLSATVFVTPEFVLPDDVVRPTSEDADPEALRCDRRAWWGYLSWAELCRMTKDHTFEIASHGMTHGWCFSGSEIVDYHHPGDPYYWLPWHLRPERKPFWLTGSAGEDAALGHPVYVHGPALLTRRYHDDRSLADRLVACAGRNGGRAFFAEDGWRRRLDAVARNHIRLHGLRDGRETVEAYHSRILWEMTESRRLIRLHTGAAPALFCWPNGAYSEEVHRMAVEVAGYETTVASEERPRLRRPDILGRIWTGGGRLRGPLAEAEVHARFIFAVESRCGPSARRCLVRLCQTARHGFGG